jgi:putative SOS response-associated peptidase YedK
MCGRYALYGPQSRARMPPDYFQGLAGYPATFNVAPGTVMPVARFDDGRASLMPARWGLVPPWAKDTKAGARCINARSETIATSPMFRGAYRSKRRCLVPADGFFEWKTSAAGKQPWYITSADDDLLVFAGLWERWHAPEGEVLTTYTILTGEPNALVQPVHTRMPVILSPEQFGTWLTADDPRELLRPCAPGRLRCYPVSARVNAPRNNDAALLEPVPAAVTSDPNGTLF